MALAFFSVAPHPCSVSDTSEDIANQWSRSWQSRWCHFCLIARRERLASQCSEEKSLTGLCENNRYSLFCFVYEEMKAAIAGSRWAVPLSSPSPTNFREVKMMRFSPAGLLFFMLCSGESDRCQYAPEFLAICVGYCAFVLFLYFCVYGTGECWSLVLCSAAIYTHAPWGSNPWPLRNARLYLLIHMHVVKMCMSLLSSWNLISAYLFIFNSCVSYK